MTRLQKQEITKYELEEDFRQETAIEFDKLYRKMEIGDLTLGQGYKSRLAEVCRSVCVLSCFEKLILFYQ